MQFWKYRKEKTTIPASQKEKNKGNKYKKSNTSKQEGSYEKTNTIDNSNSS
jgi:hypothetical protein